MMQQHYAECAYVKQYSSALLLNGWEFNSDGTNAGYTASVQILFLVLFYQNVENKK